MEPLLDRGVFRLGTVDFRWCSKQIVVQRTTGHFGYVCHEEAVPLWDFCNTSVANFLKCCEVYDLMWELQKKNQIAYEARAQWLEKRLLLIDPAALTPDTIWVELIADIRNNVV